MVATNHDITKLRELAAQGVCLTTAARLTGMTYASVRYWNGREHIGLKGRGQDRLEYNHPAPDILARYRLHQTMQRLNAWLTSV